MNAGRLAVFALVLGCIPHAADAQHRFTTEALVGLDQMPFVVADLEAAEDIWRRLGFLVKPGRPREASGDYAQIKFEDGAGIQLLAPAFGRDELATSYIALLEQAEGPARFALHARDLGAVATALNGSPFGYGPASRTFDVPGLDYLFVTQDSRAPDDGAWLEHGNGATALSRVWIAASRRDGRELGRLLAALNAEVTGAKVYAPDAVQTTVATVSNGEVLILPENRQLTPGRRIIGATFEVESLADLRRRLTSFGVPFTEGGALKMSVIVAPDVTHGLWIEFRE